MKLTLANIKELKRNSDSPLLKRVCNYVIDHWSDYNDKKGILGITASTPISLSKSRRSYETVQNTGSHPLP